ncbi:hypothetical protein B0H13DRAFT_992953 [Mycena leptocephala]|nr:hypothetical protein B0H13DRAFT_992953 [Mycena leptocephala]
MPDNAFSDDESGQDAIEQIKSSGKRILSKAQEKASDRSAPAWRDNRGRRQTDTSPSKNLRIAVKQKSVAFDATLDSTEDDLVKQIDAVGREDGILHVYFCTAGGKRIKETSEVCADLFPKMLIKFYEANICWKDGERTRNGGLNEYMDLGGADLETIFATGQVRSFFQLRGVGVLFDPASIRY